MMSDFPPTAQDRKVSEELTLLIDEQLKQYESLMENNVKAFNTAFAALELDYLSTTN